MYVLSPPSCKEHLTILTKEKCTMQRKVCSKIPPQAGKYFHCLGGFSCILLESSNASIYVWLMGQTGGRIYIDHMSCGIAARARSIHKLLAWILSSFNSMISHKRLPLYYYKAACHGDQRRGLICAYKDNACSAVKITDWKCAAVITGIFMWGKKHHLFFQYK